MKGGVDWRWLFHQCEGHEIELSVRVLQHAEGQERVGFCLYPSCLGCVSEVVAKTIRSTKCWNSERPAPISSMARVTCMIDHERRRSSSVPKPASESLRLGHTHLNVLNLQPKSCRAAHVDLMPHRQHVRSREKVCLRTLASCLVVTAVTHKSPNRMAECHLEPRPTTSRVSSCGKCTTLRVKEAQTWANHGGIIPPESSYQLPFPLRRARVACFLLSTLIAPVARPHRQHGSLAHAHCRHSWQRREYRRSSSYPSLRKRMIAANLAFQLNMSNPLARRSGRAGIAGGCYRRELFLYS